MRQVVGILLILTSFRAGAPAAEPAGGPALLYEIAEARGQVISTAWGWSEPIDAEPNQVAVLSYTTFTRGGDSRVRAVFTRDTPPRCISWDVVLHDKAGAVVSTTQSRWVADLFPLLSGPLPPDAYPVEAPLGHVVTHLGLGARQQASFRTVLIDTLPRFDLWIDGKETLHVPAGAFECYRVRMRANAQTLFPKLPGFLRPFLSFFIPTYTMWLTTAEPQTLIQYAGQMGPPGSPELLVRLSQVRAAGSDGS